MIVIKDVLIQKFRSCRKTEIKNLESCTIISGKNNTGKSNILRAISLFFNEEIEPNVKLDISRDCSAARGTKKEITVSIHFTLSDELKIQKTIEEMENRIPRDCWIKKVYYYDPSSPYLYTKKYFVNDIESPKSDEVYVDQFVSLFNFRYITSDRSARGVLEDNLKELQAELNYRLSQQKDKNVQKNIEEAINTVNDISKTFFNPISQTMSMADDNISEVLLSAPSNIIEMIKYTSYKMILKDGEEHAESLQGSGIQSFLLFSVLVLIDKNYHRKFGWKIATIWAIEEPEVFLHYDLEIKLAKYFQSLCQKKTERFQILSTTHSPVFIQYSDHQLFCSLDKTGLYNTVVSSYDAVSFIKKLEEEKVTNITHLFSLFQNKRIILVEGYIDEYIFESHVQKTDNILVYSIATFLGNKELCGCSNLIRFAEGNIDIINARDKNCGIYIVVDWDVPEADVKFLKKHIKTPSKLIQLDYNKGNVLLDKKFRGIEKYYPTNIIEKIKNCRTDLIWDKGADKIKDRFSCCDGDQYKEIKHLLFEEIQLNPPKFELIESIITQIKKI